MVNVTVPAAMDVEQLLQQVEADWAALPQVAAEIERWDQIEAIDFIEEWPLAEQRLARLKDQGALTPAQQQRYHTVLALVEQLRPLITRLQAA